MVLSEMAGAEDTIYLCNFRVSVDGDWLCLKELAEGTSTDTNQAEASSPSPATPPSTGANDADDGGCMYPPTFTELPPNPPHGSRLASISGLPPGLFAPYVPLSCERDPVSIERSNLVNICKLVVKELIESSLKYGRQLDSDSVPLQHFFIVLEHVLRHGLKPKRGMFGPKKELWDLFQNVEKWTYEAQDITASVRDLPTVKTHIGRARAWLRLALMQKKLADYFRLLLERRDDFLLEFYEAGSLMLSDEAIVIMGLLVGLNVIDCNLCVKEEDLDSQMGVIDFSLYLRTSGGEVSPEEPPEQADMTTVLDQKNYIEELNRHLNATVTNLQAKVETLQTTNALMKEDLAIAKTTISQMRDENEKLRKGQGLPTQHQQDMAEREARKAARISVIGCEEELQDLKRQIREEGSHRKQIERELELQIQMKAESEMAAKLLEKDIHEKQDTIISLRQQLDDIKSINLEMFSKLGECESSLKEKTEVISKLENKVSQMGTMIRKMESELEVSEIKTEAAQTTASKLSDKLTEYEEELSSVKSALEVETEWRKNLEQLQLKSKETVSKLRAIQGEYDILKNEHEVLIEKSKDQEKTMTELGAHLSDSKLKITEMNDVSKHIRNAQWVSDKESPECNLCKKEFSISRRRHHCRHCGNIFCNSCSDNTIPLPSSARPVRVCDTCHEKLLERYSAS